MPSLTIWALSGLRAHPHILSLLPSPVLGWNLWSFLFWTRSQATASCPSHYLPDLGHHASSPLLLPILCWQACWCEVGLYTKPIAVLPYTETVANISKCSMNKLLDPPWLELLKLSGTRSGPDPANTQMLLHFMHVSSPIAVRSQLSKGLKHMLKSFSTEDGI